MSMLEADQTTHDPETPIEQKTRRELRVALARTVGARNKPKSSLTKPTLNSLYAYKTGEFYIPPVALQRPQHAEFARRFELVHAVGMAYDIGDEPEDDDEVPRWRELPDCVTRDEVPREFLRDELEELLGKVYDMDDQRDWTQ